MAGQVLYRKWRPRTLSEVVGQGPIVQTLLNALRQSKVSHAYLLCGPRGTGKTSTARILAKALNCETTQGRGEPCDACAPCREIGEGSFLDLIEVDGASNRGIDEIRDLRDKVRFMPARGRYKVYIIDEVHMLTEQAFNALLKTLEEPPAHAVFILATTEPHKVPLTISSRCQRFDFRRIPPDEAIDRLAEIGAHEGFSLERGTLELVVRAANGSLRDAENLLEQLVLTAGPQATPEDARALFGVAGSLRARQLIASLLGDKDLAAALTSLARLQADGVDMRQVHRELVEELRTLLLLRAGAGAVLDLSSAELEERRQTASSLDLAAIRSALEALATLALPPGSSPLPLEMAFVQVSLQSSQGPAQPPSTPAPERPSALAPAPSLREDPAPRPGLARRPRVEAAAPEPRPPVAPPSEPAPARAVRERPPAAPPPKGPALEVQVDAPAPPVAADTPPRISPIGPFSDSLTIDEVRTRWREIVDAMRGLGSSGNLDAYLRSVSHPLALEDGILVVGFYHEFHRAKIEDPKYRHLVERKITQILGKPYRLRCELVERPQRGGHLLKAALERGARLTEMEPEQEEEGGGPA